MSDERETLDIDVLFVGAGPASLAGAYHLARLVRERNALLPEPLELSIAILEKGRKPCARVDLIVRNDCDVAAGSERGRQEQIHVLLPALPIAAVKENDHGRNAGGKGAVDVERAACSLRVGKGRPLPRRARGQQVERIGRRAACREENREGANSATP